MSDVYRKVQHINSGCRKIDGRVFELCEVFKHLNLSEENQRTTGFCKLCGSSKNPYKLSIPAGAPISVSINPENPRQESMIISQVNGSRNVADPGITSHKPSEFIVLKSDLKHQINHNDNRCSVVSEHQSVKKELFSGSVSS